jgi:hypothetical protein
MLTTPGGCWLMIAAAAAAAAAIGCNDLVKDTADLTPPGVVLEVRGADGRFRPATEATFEGAFTAGRVLELRCIVTDTGGVSRATLTFQGNAEACDAAGRRPAPDAAVYLTGLPPARSITADDDGSAAASGRLLVTASLPSGIGCYGYTGALRFEGVPRGQRLEVRCTGENWSVNPSTRKAQRVLDVELQP